MKRGAAPKRLLALAWLVLLAGCGSPLEFPKLGTDAEILAFGDSLTFGTGARPEQSYPAVLESLIGRKVINAGVPGEVSAEALARLPRMVEKHRPALVILCTGGNDFLRRVGKAQIEQNLRASIEYLRAEGTPVMLLGVPEFGIFLSAADFYEEVAEDLQVPIENDIIPDLLGDNNFKSDQIHPNAAGYRRLAEAIAALLERHGAL